MDLRNWWISSTAVFWLDACGSIHPGATCNRIRTSLSRQMTKSLRDKREQWWIGKCREMGMGAVFDIGRNLCRLVRNCGSRKSTMRKAIKQSDG